MPSLNTIKFALELGAKALDEVVAPGIEKALSADLPEIFGGNGRLGSALFRRAVELAPDTLARKQLVGMQAVATRLSTVGIENIRPYYDSNLIISSPAYADLITADGTRSSGFLHILGEEPFASTSRQFQRLRTDVPTQFISANLFNTVPKSAVREFSLSADMFADRSFFAKRAAQARNDSWQIDALERSARSGNPVKVIVSNNAGKTVYEEFARSDRHRSMRDPIKEMESMGLGQASKKAIVDREIIGDSDHNWTNFTFVVDSEPTIHNIDLEKAFTTNSKPTLRDFWLRPLSRQILGSSMVSHIGRFVDAYGTRQGFQILEDLQMYPPEIDGVLSRAQWFVDHKTLPPW